ncbi:MAG: stage V sporulation protein AE [Clostridia bacterium]|nr:stage V sporulation protein AE [Clostridia bacterium]
MIYLWAFLVGGGICAIAQIFIDKTKLTPARILVGCVVLGVFLSGLGLYEPLAKFAGAGARVPLLGFGHTLCQGVKETIDAEGVIGIIKGGLTATSIGITAAMTLSLLAAIIFKGKPK